jgi:hypothetical protein
MSFIQSIEHRTWRFEETGHRARPALLAGAPMRRPWAP